MRIAIKGIQNEYLRMLVMYSGVGYELDSVFNDAHTREERMTDNDATTSTEDGIPRLTIQQVRKLCYSKRLNFLLGAGASQPAITTLGDGVKIESLINPIQQVSKNILHEKDAGLSPKERATHDAYRGFVDMIIAVLNMSNSRVIPRSANIFTTNYDLFVEDAMDRAMRDNYGIIFNDGANGYFKRYVNTYNYDRATALRGQFDNYNHETPTIRLIKPHGSINWHAEQEGSKHESIEVMNSDTMPNEPFVVLPDGLESGQTMQSRHFFEMLRLFNIELDKSQSILFVIGFSFQDRHIKDMLMRALQNPGLLVCVFAYTDETTSDDGGARKIIEDNLNAPSNTNLVVFSPKDVAEFLQSLDTTKPMKTSATTDKDTSSGADEKNDKSEAIKLDLRTVTKLLMPTGADNPSLFGNMKDSDK